MSYRDLRFYGFVSGCLLAAGLLFALLASGEIAGPKVAQLPAHQVQHK
jgi:hypothetical protein